MNQYGRVAITAAELATQASALDPEEAWKEAAMQHIGDNSSRDKSCPKGTFLTLCEIGAVRNVPKGTYGKRTRPKRLTERPLAALRADPSLADKTTALWTIALEGEKYRKPNGEMDVLVALFNEKYLVGT